MTHRDEPENRIVDPRPEREGGIDEPAPGAGDGMAVPAPEAQHDDEEGRRPTPVRQAMEGSEGEEPEASGDRRVLPDPEKGEEWVVTVAGRSASGILPLRTVPLLELHFAPLHDPETPLRRVLCQGTDLKGLRDDELFSSFGASEPIPDPRDAPPPSDRPKKRGKGRKSTRP